MEYVILWVRYGTPFLLLMQLFAISYLIWSVKDMKNDIENIKDSMIWDDTFKIYTENIERRISRLEKLQNGK